MDGIVAGLGILFFYCYFGTEATESFEKMADSLFESNWFDLPIKLQKYMIIMIANMQRSIYYHGFEFGNLDLKTCIRERSIWQKSRVISNI